MPAEPHHGPVERAQAEQRQRRDALAAATEAAQAGMTTHEVDGGDIRVAVTGRFRIGELYVSERALRWADIEQRLVAAVNEAMAAAQAAHAEQVRTQLDADTAGLVAAADELADSLREGTGPRRPGPEGADR